MLLTLAGKIMCCVFSIVIHYLADAHLSRQRVGAHAHVVVHAREHLHRCHRVQEHKHQQHESYSAQQGQRLRLTGNALGSRHISASSGANSERQPLRFLHSLLSPKVPDSPP